MSMALAADRLCEPLAGEDWKKRGEDVGGFCEVSCDNLLARGVVCDGGCREACEPCEASERN